MSGAAASRGALDGLIVLDLTQMLAGPYATMLLADQGARVIKVEPPGGDTTRQFGPHLEGAMQVGDGGFGAYFASIGRNKTSIALDLKKAAGKAAFLRMVVAADVVVENFRAGVMDKLGLGYEVLIKENPRLVYAALRGFGDPRTGETAYTHWPAYDPVAQAMGGIMGITGATPGGDPTKVGPGVGDLIPAVFLAYGIASACWSVQRTGKGQFIDVAMVDAVLAMCERLVFQYSATAKVPGAEGNGHPLLCPFGIFPAQDGHVSLGVPLDHFWVPLTRLMGQPELATDPRFESNVARVSNKSEVIRLVSDWTSRHTKRELSALLGGLVPFGAIFNAADIFQDPHFRIRGMLAEVEQPGAARPLTVAGTPIRMTETPGSVRHRAPLTGEHTHGTLAGFGFTDAEIDALVTNRVVF